MEVLLDGLSIVPRGAKIKAALRKGLMGELPVKAEVDLAVVQPMRSGLLAALPWLRHGFSSRAGGVSTVYGRGTDLNLGLTPLDVAENVQENRRRLVEATCGLMWPVVMAPQTHSAKILVVDAASDRHDEADGLVSSTTSLLLGILTADCVPVLLVDTRLRVVAAVHAGWRGTAARIAGKAVQTMRTKFGSNPGDILAAIGPSIGPCCYSVGDVVREAFADEHGLFQNNRLDLWLANRSQLLAAGVRGEAIETLGLCTACARNEGGRLRFFSHRAEHGRTGRMMALIGVDAAGSAPIG